MAAVEGQHAGEELEHQLLNLLSEQQKYEETHRLEFFEPYDYQKRFYYAKGHLTDALAIERYLKAANQIGKTTGAAYEVSLHLTGLYPDDWEGHRFDHPVNWQAGGNTNDDVRDICQAELFGDPTDDEKLGTGMVPKHLINEKARKAGVINAFDSVSVRHVTGGLSKISFKAYEQGPKKHMGRRIDGGWCDEEPPLDILNQYRRATFATGGILMITFTPEDGYTVTVYEIMNSLKSGQAVIEATWDDAPHMTPERRKSYLARIPENERDMRSRGIPKVGSGLVFPFQDEDIVIQPVQIQHWWRIICGVDFGIDHPFAAVWIAIDPDTQKKYIFDVWKKSGALISTHADAIKQRGDWIPIAWPHDGMQRDKQSGVPFADLYRDKGLRMLPKCFTNPPAPGREEGTGGQGVEVGLVAMKEEFETGQLKVFSTCQEWLDEQKTYHRQDGSVVKRNDDAISASRYAFQSLRFADTKPVQVKRQPVRAGLSNW